MKNWTIQLLILIITVIGLSFSASVTWAQSINPDSLSVWIKEIQKSDTLNNDLFEKDLRLRFLFKLKNHAEKAEKQGFKVNFNLLNKILDQMIQDSFDLQLNKKQVFLDPIALFIKNLKICLELDYEKTQDLQDYIRIYMENSGIRKPTPVNEFLSERNYLGKGQYQTAEPLSLEEAGQTAELILQNKNESNLDTSSDQNSSNDDEGNEEIEMDPSMIEQNSSFDANSLNIDELKEANFAELSTEAALFDPSKGQSWMRFDKIILNNSSSLNP